MTTIAWKGDIIAADSQLTIGDSVRIISSPKIIQIGPSTVIAVAGDTDETLKAINFFSKEGWQEKLDDTPDKMELEALLWHGGKMYLLDGTLYPEPLVVPYHAVGNGWQLALAAMALGKSAEEAVIFTAEHNIYTNNKIQIFDVSKLQAQAKAPRRKQ